MASQQTVTALQANLHNSATQIKKTHLRDLLDGPRDDFIFSLNDLSVDATRQPLTADIISNLCRLADYMGLNAFQQQMIA